ncbi:MAG TPA: hypothetical protein VGQ42_15675 [Candidatus Dormibacteraeota bacterium]|jgi:hypothetical protein|nr:hypothetical protein [Candidatus Dormibacteraeota bacterium]
MGVWTGHEIVEKGGPEYDHAFTVKVIVNHPAGRERAMRSLRLTLGHLFKAGVLDGYDCGESDSA